MTGNPKAENARLRDCFESLGFKQVRTVISSGNVIFESSGKNAAALGRKIENALAKKLDFKTTTMVRSQKQWEALIKRNPFKGVKDEKPNYLVVTFFKDNRPEVATHVDLRKTGGPEMMSDLLKKYGKEITTRTWKTVHRIQKKMEEGVSATKR